MSTNNRRSTLLLSAGAALFFTLLACRFFQQTPTPTPYPVPPLDQLQFDDPQTGARFKALNACIQDLTGSSWKGGAFELLGNFYQADWCTGSGARDDCQIAAGTIDFRDQHVIELYSLFYGYDFSRMFGLGLQSLWVPASTGWGANFSFAEQGQNTVGEGWGVTFRQYLTNTQPADATVDLDWNYGYTIYGPNRITIELAHDLPLREDLARYLVGPEAMRDLALSKIRSLAADVEGQLQDHKISGCDLTPSQNGIPPICHPRHMTPAEEAAEIEKAQKYFASEEALLTAYYQEMYAAWMTSFPLNQCWP